MAKSLATLGAVAFGAALTFGTLAEAQDACAEITDSTERLACYDAANAPPDPGDWQALEDEGSLAIALRAATPIACSPFLPIERPILLVRCQDNTTSVIFSTRACRFASSGQQGAVSLDGGDFEDADFLSGDNDRALGAWVGNQSVPLAREMVEAETMRVRAIPQSGTPFTARFDLAGFGVALAPIRETCQW